MLREDCCNNIVILKTGQRCNLHLSSVKCQGLHPLNSPSLFIPGLLLLYELLWYTLAPSSKSNDAHAGQLKMQGSTVYTHKKALYALSMKACIQFQGKLILGRWSTHSCFASFECGGKCQSQVIFLSTLHASSMSSNGKAFSLSDTATSSIEACKNCGQQGAWYEFEVLWQFS